MIHDFFDLSSFFLRISYSKILGVTLSMKKSCSKCKELKNESEFYRKSPKGNSSNSLCKECFNSYCKERWHKKKILAVAYKGGSCNRCGYNSHVGALQFHHVDPSLKSFTWTKMRLKNWESIKKELDKCELLCANCHSIEHCSF